MRIPFVERDVPIIADEVVDRAFGTGAVKITPAHDHDDYATGQRHGLPTIDVLADDATINEHGDRYAGLDRYEARQRIVADLEARGDLAGAAPHEMVIGRCQRSNDVIEPRLKTQWFIRTGPLAARALDATRSGRTRILPERFEKVWEHWLTNIRDWNVSRQLWWGHRIPAWYCPDGHVTVSRRPGGPAACEACGRPAAELTQDPDIFDTWFSSGLWPFSTLGWPDDTPDLATLLPDVGHGDRLRHHLLLGRPDDDARPPPDRRGAVPHGLPVTGSCATPTARRCRRRRATSSTRSGVIDESGADALRFALIHGTAPGNDQRFGSGKLENARNFANKLWNATRFVLGARPASIAADAERRLPPTRAPRAGRALDAVARRGHRRRGRRGDGRLRVRRGDARSLYDAIWNEFCDWGLELAKVRLADDDAARRRARGDVVDARRGARHVPAPAPPGHAVRDRGAVGARSRIARATPSC